MRAFDKIIIALGVVMAVVVASGILLSARVRVSNCGGNSAALSACRNSALELVLAADKIEKFTNISQLPPDERTMLVQNSRSSWLLGAKILVKTNINLNVVPKQILLVCDTLFDNVPLPTIWTAYRKNPAHAVGYSDGTVGLIFPVELKKLNLSGFVDTSLLSTNTVTASKTNSPE